jgi:hypothetical protein
MPVTDTQAAALRAQLAGQADEHKQLFAQLDWGTEGTAFTALIDAGFFKAVDQRFSAATTPADVIAYVGDVRSRFTEAASAIDPETAERLILKVLGRGSAASLDPVTAFRARQFLLAALIADQHLDDAGLDDFMAQARKLADQWLA